MKILDNFIEITKAQRDWKISDISSDLVDKIKRMVQDKKVFLLLSGGVDSTVCFVLLNKALGKDKVLGLHVDTGFMRKNESRDASSRSLIW